VDKLIFEFNLEKAIEVAAMLRKLHGENILATELLQMLYLIDRCSIRDTNYPIIGGTYVRYHNERLQTIMIEEVYQLIFWHYKLPVEVQERQLKWKEYFSTHEEEDGEDGLNEVFLDLTSDPGNQNLSEREEEQIRVIYETIRYLDLGSSIFNFPEWEDLYNYSTLDIVKLLKVLEKTDEEIEEIKSTVAREKYLNNLKNNETN